MAQWFRMYESILDDPKVQKLKPELFRAWVNILALTCRRDGVLPGADDIAFALRISEKQVAELLSGLATHGLLDRHGDGYEPHNWRARQYKSDTSADRMRRHRERHRDVTPPVTVTRSESETDTETDSVPNGTGAAAPVDPVKALFDAGVELLTKAGTRPTNARSLIGKWRSDHGDESVMAAIGAANAAKVSEPTEWVTKYLANHAKPQARQPFETYEQARIRRGRELLAQ